MVNRQISDFISQCQVEARSGVGLAQLLFLLRPFQMSLGFLPRINHSDPLVERQGIMLMNEGLVLGFVYLSKTLAMGYSVQHKETMHALEKYTYYVSILICRCRHVTGYCTLHFSEDKTILICPYISAHQKDCWSENNLTCLHFYHILILKILNVQSHAYK